MINTFEPTTALNVYSAAIEAAHTSADPNKQIAQLIALLSSVTGASVLLFVYDDARRLIAQDGAADTASHKARLHRYWHSITRAVMQRSAVDTEHAIVVPLAAEQQIVGIALLESSQPHNAALRDAVALLLAGALLREARHTRNAAQQREAATYRSVTQALLNAQTSAELFEYATTALQQLSGAAQSMIFLCDDEGWLRPASRRTSGGHKHPAIPLNGSHIGTAVQTAQPFVTTLSTADWKLPASAGVPATVEMLAVPLRRAHSVVGVLTALGKPGGFTPNDVQIVSNFADHVALVFERINNPNTQSAQLPMLLTKRERAVLALIAQGATNQEIARQLTITERTVSTHLSNTLEKLGLANRTQAALYALQHGIR